MPDISMTFTYEYFEKTKRYFFSNEITNEAPVIEASAALQASSDDAEAVYEAGIAFADTNYFNNYSNFDFHKKHVVISRIRETTTINDNRVFILKYGSWFSSQEPTVVLINNTSKAEIATADFLAIPEEGKIILDDELASGYSVLVTIAQDINFKLGAEFASYDDDVDVSDIGITWNNDERGLAAVNTTRLPTAENVYISPTSPSGGNALYANYVLYDINGTYIQGDGLSLGTTVNWYKNGSLQSAYENILRIPGGAIQYGSVWYFMVVPYDSIRGGNSVQSASVTVSRGQPIASSVLISPTTATTTNDLVLTYVYDSPDGTDESGTELRWYLNNALQTQYNGRISIFSSETSSGQNWYATVRPYDGYNFGSMVQSNIVVIDHSPPTLGNSLAIYPNNPENTDDLYVQYNFSSAEGLSQYGPFPDWSTDHPDEDYPLTATIIRWYKNSVLQLDLNNQVSISNLLIKSGDEFCVKVTPGDHIVRGIEAVSSKIIIG